MNTLLEQAKPQFMPPLDENFRPAALVNRAFRQMGDDSGDSTLLVLGLALGGGFLRHGDYWHSPGTMMGGSYGSMHASGGGSLMVLLGAAVIGGILLLAAGLGRRETGSLSRDESPLEILKRRYASGEIDHEEYEQIKETLFK